MLVCNAGEPYSVLHRGSRARRDRARVAVTRDSVCCVGRLVQDLSAARWHQCNINSQAGAHLEELAAVKSRPCLSFWASGRLFILTDSGWRLVVTLNFAQTRTLRR